MKRELLLLALAVFAVGRLSVDATAPSKLRLATLFPYTGGGWDYGVEMQWGLDYAIAEINAASTILPNTQLVADMDSLDATTGRRLQDSQCFAPSGVTAMLNQMNKVYADVQPSAVIGAGCSGSSIPAAQIATFYQIPIVSPSSTSAELSNKEYFPYFARTTAPEAQTASALLKFTEFLGYRRVGFVYSDLPIYALAVKNAFIDKWKGDRVFEEQVKDSKLTGLTASQTLERLVTQGVTVLLFALYDADKAKINEAAERMGIRDDPNFLFVWEWPPPESDYHFGLTASAVNTARSNRVQAAARDTTPGAAGPGYPTGTGTYDVWIGNVYDAVWMVATAADAVIRRGGTPSGLELMHAINVTSIDGTTGTVVLDENLDRRAKIDVYQMQNGTEAVAAQVTEDGQILVGGTIMKWRPRNGQLSDLPPPDRPQCFNISNCTGHGACTFNVEPDATAAARAKLLGLANGPTNAPWLKTSEGCTCDSGWTGPDCAQQGGDFPIPADMHVSPDASFFFRKAGNPPGSQASGPMGWDGLGHKILSRYLSIRSVNVSAMHTVQDGVGQPYNASAVSAGQLCRSILATGPAPRTPTLVEGRREQFAVVYMTHQSVVFPKDHDLDELQSGHVCLDPRLEARTIYQPELAVLVNDGPKVTSLYSAIFSALIDPQVITIFCVYVLAILISAHIVYFSERHENPDEFPTRYMDGIDDGAWWACVTATSTGYGDKVPTTVGGRLWGVVWMNLGIVIFALVASLFTNKMSAAAVDRGIYQLDDISPTHRIAIMSDVYHRAKKYMVLHTRASNWAGPCDPDECIRRLQSDGEDAVDAVVGTAIRLQLMIDETNSRDDSVSGRHRLYVTGPGFDEGAVTWKVVTLAGTAIAQRFANIENDIGTDLTYTSFQVYESYSGPREDSDNKNGNGKSSGNNSKVAAVQIVDASAKANSGGGGPGLTTEDVSEFEEDEGKGTEGFDNPLHVSKRLSVDDSSKQQLVPTAAPASVEMTATATA
eukprot:g1121.t1